MQVFADPKLLAFPPQLKNTFNKLSSGLLARCMCLDIHCNLKVTGNSKGYLAQYLKICQKFI